MSKFHNLRNSIKQGWRDRGLFVDTYSPGDGVTRYRFFLTDSDYFSDHGIYTALGWKEAVTFAAGFMNGVHRGLLISSGNVS